MARECEKCGKKEGLLAGEHTEIAGKLYCKSCAPRVLDQLLRDVVITTTPQVEGHRIKEYLGLESVEIVIGTGSWSEFTGDLADIFGSRVTAFEKKLKKARDIAEKRLKYLAIQRGGNAVVGVDLDYTEFDKNRVGLIINGTVVQLIEEEVS